MGSQECRDFGVCKSVINAALESYQVKFVTAIRPKGHHSVIKVEEGRDAVSNGLLVIVYSTSQR